MSPDHPSAVRSIPAYPYNYPAYTSCQWFLHTTIEGGYFNLNFINFHLVTDKDYVIIGMGRDMTNSSTVLRLSGISAPNTLTVPGPTMWVNFVSTDGWWLGFTIEIHAEGKPG